MTQSNGTALAQVAQTDAEKALVQQFASMVTSLPVIPQDGGLGILASIFAATTLEELDRTWTDKGEDWALDRDLIFERLEYGESDFASGIGFYILVHGTDPDSGEEFVFSTGSVNVMGQLVMAHSMGQLPFVGRIVRNDRATRNGYHPQHIIVSRDQSLVRTI